MEPGISRKAATRRPRTGRRSISAADTLIRIY
jgi:hypothetical protein